MKTIKTVGVVGAGTMGSALAQKFLQEGFKVILADRAINFAEKGLEMIRSSLNQGLQKYIFTYEQLSEYLSNLKITDTLTDLKGCDLIVEAIYENFNAKTTLFKELCVIIPPDTILATNTSSFSVTELSAAVSHPERFIGLHYFYHAAKNRLVEIIPGDKTSEETTQTAYRFSILSGKDPIYSRDAYGFVVNRFFVPWLNEAVRLYEENVASIEQIETVCKELFGITMGPFELMNVTGIPVAYHAEKTLEVFGNLYKVAKALEKQTKENQLWTLKIAGEEADKTIPIKVKQEIKDRMLGVIFFICSQILDEKICSAAEIDRGAKIGLKWKKGPIELMKEQGEDEVTCIIVKLIDRYNMKLPDSIGKKYWTPNYVKLKSKGTIAVITMDQPENLNALSEETVKQLGECFNKAERNPLVKTVFITGSGKAFVAGADIKFFVKNIKKERICDIETFTEFGQKIFDNIDNSSKKVVAIINGLALGGGLELALCADVILALPKAQMAFPETGIGIYPGLGGTQRSVRKIGRGLSKYLIHTGKMLSATEAEEIGLVDKIISREEMFSILSGEIDAPLINKKNMKSEWIAIRDFFEKNSLKAILDKNYSDAGLTSEYAEKLAKTVRFKAPIALKLADQLIDEAKGCTSELEHLREIFSTSDALLGLTSIGEKVNYLGK
ncbi:MAG: 3-hydroxyacyl-CoA dehydrogenase/enoyl-CoA hydratase family protein [Bacteroidetes bacterium]|nr:3-hydroxyacyl-CoA dehydrogenase/enoyl-CoA hydratase family protein [Bacteroidota bacterium]